MGARATAPASLQCRTRMQPPTAVSDPGIGTYSVGTPAGPVARSHRPAGGATGTPERQEDPRRAAPLDPRARRLWHRLRRRRPRPLVPRHRRRRPRRPRLRQASGRRGRRRPHGGRVGAAGADTAAAVRRGQRRGRAVRPGGRPAAGGRGRAVGRGPGPGRLARAADRPGRPRRPGPPDRAPRGPRRLRWDRRRGHPRFRGRAPGAAPAPPHRARHPGHLRGVVLVPHDGLQGPRPGRPPGRLLPRPARGVLRRHVRRLPPAVLDQHAAHLGAGPAVPDAVPQRRDQRPVGQREPHARPGRAGHGGRRPRRRGPVLPRVRRGRLRLGQARLGGRAADAGRARSPPRHGDADARGLGERARPRPRDPGLLPLPLGPHGALGRAGRRDLHRRQGHRGPARPQRPAAAALPDL